ncbi:L-threonylcarbamoyladenylate synthase [Alteriqipengyuania lutimaris]|uniref:Threonylcarbamoyl-AMP synthase n=1 Tax=Alteriqipengyuania lutimaris TaxID=1538146 RepID=A0A395LK18_9SPHN|nr:L-threonylcarbamoyladenylate synthase [Alteriqipengyuania lutimaris]MBB3034425.1 L-threonylcarbamoyladenylate synthase [Alteriqipengyuania lutimaris]RDS76677.1 threonylcarbamoyl-AMP synthase [Alteriqipengyuania lutimaris]
MDRKYVTETVLADEAGIARAADILRDGGLVAVPTETVYGLAARADSEEAVARIFAAKGRPSFNPLIVHVRDEAQAAHYAQWDDAARVAVATTWPGPLTLVVPRRPDAGLASAVTAGLPTVALRCPAHPVMQELLGRVDFPLAAPSANRSGFISPTSAQHVLTSLDGRIDMVLDGGVTQAGVESTILAIRGDGSWEELRAGPVDLDALHRQHRDADMPGRTGRATLEAPGQLASHYSPGKPMRLGVTDPHADEFMIGFGAVEGDVTLSAGGDLTEAASNLYACLHLAAVFGKPRIAVAPVPEERVGRAINDRLRRAATPPGQSSSGS